MIVHRGETTSCGSLLLYLIDFVSLVCDLVWLSLLAYPISRVLEYFTTLQLIPYILVQIAMCDICGMIIKQCPFYADRVISLLQLAFIAEIIMPLSYCIQLGVESLGISEINCLPQTSTEATISDPSSEERPDPVKIFSEKLDSIQPVLQFLPELDVSDTTASSQEHESTETKRRRLSTKRKSRRTGLSVTYTGSISLPAVNVSLETPSEAAPVEEDPSVLGSSDIIDGLLLRFTSEQQRHSSASSVQKELLKMMDALEPREGMNSDISDVEGLLAALCVLVRVFAKHPGAVCNRRSIQLFHKWMPWILKEV